MLNCVVPEKQLPTALISNDNFYVLNGFPKAHVLDIRTTVQMLGCRPWEGASRGGTALMDGLMWSLHDIKYVFDPLLSVCLALSPNLLSCDNPSIFAPQWVSFIFTIRFSSLQPGAFPGKKANFPKPNFFLNTTMSFTILVSLKYFLFS